jgi:predicted DNA-binding transcriptional regulator YafY
VDKFDRIYALHKMLSAAHHPVLRTRIEAEFECGRGTIGRTINYMRDFLGAPIEYDLKRHGYYYDRKDGNHPYELPGLWFNAHELQALATLSQLIGDLQPGLLEEQLRPFQKRIEQLLDNKQFGNGQLKQKIRLLGMGVRNGGDAFQKCAEGVLQRKQLLFEYHSRGKDEINQRTVSPQRLVHYRDNWYLDAHCHLRDELRNFSIDRINNIQLLDTSAQQIDEQQLQEHFADAYGIFAGKGDNSAVLHFNAYRARWVSEERWHPKQQGCFLEDGRYELRIPYGQSQELIMDILKYGPDVEVIEPQSLRDAIQKRLESALKNYAKG